MSLPAPLRFAAVSLMLASLALPGCSCSSPGDADVKVVQQQSYGQQLIDLDAAHQKGLISDKDYKKSRDAIVQRMMKD